MKVGEIHHNGATASVYMFPEAEGYAAPMTCHIAWEGHHVLVAIGTWEVLEGDALPRPFREWLEERLETLLEIDQLAQQP
jgi:hypothetical protein